jgi:hypothetical protein
MTGKLTALIGVGAVVLSGCAGGGETPSPAESEAAPVAEDLLGSRFVVPPQVSINEVMVAVVDHASHELWHVAIEEQAPETDEDWRELEHHAIQLASAGSWVSLGGIGEADQGWVKLVGWSDYAQGMTDAAVTALEATRARDLEALIEAGDALVETCEACHKEFKPELPSEGYVHPHYLR